MSRRVQKWLLVLAFFGLVPVPFIMVATGFAPPLRVLFLSSVLGAIAIVDGAEGPLPIILGIRTNPPQKGTESIDTMSSTIMRSQRRV